MSADLSDLQLPPAVDPTTLDDGRVDSIAVYDRETGLTSQRSIAITPEQERERDLADMRHGLESVERRIAAYDPTALMPWEEPPTEAQIARVRESLENERAFCLAEIARLEANAPIKRRR